MPRLRDGRRGEPRRRTIGIAALSLSALAGLSLWLRGADDAADGPRPGRVTAPWEAGRTPRDTLAGRPAGTPANAPPPGSMQESLLKSTGNHRRQLFWRAITGAGFDCADVRMAGAVGDTGSAWRANCGDASIYLIEIDAFGRLSVAPMPYGDLYPPGIELNVPEEEIRYQFPE